MVLHPVLTTAGGGHIEVASEIFPGATPIVETYNVLQDRKEEGNDAKTRQTRQG